MLGMANQVGSLSFANMQFVGQIWTYRSSQAHHPNPSTAEENEARSGLSSNGCSQQSISEFSEAVSFRMQILDCASHQVIVRHVNRDANTPMESEGRTNNLFLRSS